MTRNNIFFRHQNDPWNIFAPSVMSLATREDSYCSGIVKRPENKTWREYFGELWQQRKPYSVDENGIAHIDVFGVLLFRETEFMTALYGGTDYTEIMAEMDVAENDPNVNAIMLTVDSPGGMAFGNNRCAQRVASCSKKVFAHTDGLCCSAAYSIACGVDYLAATEDSDIGCIGTILPMLDVSGMWEEFGVKPDYITNREGDLKAETYPPSRTPEQKASLQSQVEDTYALFKNHVLAHRKLESDSMRGQTFVGSRAKERGLVDEICDRKTARNNLVGLLKI